MNTEPATIARSTDGQAWAEVDAAIIHNGQTFTAGGAAYVAGQFLMAYAIENPTSDTARHLFGRGIGGGTLQTWNGETLCRYRVTSRWVTYSKYGERYNWHAIRATYDGLDWHGRYCVDTGQLVRLRPYKGQAKGGTN